MAFINYGGGAYVVQASGTSSDVPNIALEPGAQYRLTINLPIPAPGWLSGVIHTALASAGVKVESVMASGNSFIIYLRG